MIGGAEEAEEECCGAEEAEECGGAEEAEECILGIASQY